MAKPIVDQSDDIAVLIPCYNEVLTIGDVIKDFANYLPYANIYVYDNNSTDGTFKHAQTYEKDYKVHVRHCYKQGKGNVIKQMFKEIDADIYIMVDGDSTYHASDAPALVNGIKRDYDMMLGDRLTASYTDTKVRPFHGFGNKLVRYCVNRLYHGSISDVMTGYRAFNKRFVKEIDIKSSGFEIETELCIYALQNDYRIGATPVEYTDRPDGSKSKLNTISDGVRVLETIVQMR